MRGADVSGLILDYVDLTTCLFNGAHGLDSMGLGSGVDFGTTPHGLWTRRDTIAEEHLWRVYETPGLDTSPPNASRVPGDWSIQTYSASTARGSGLNPGFQQASDVASIYRQLRKAREDANDSPGAADFYYGEMEMRRSSLRERTNRRRSMFGTRVERVLLFGYWLIAGYGLRAWRPVATLLGLVLLAALGLDHGGFQAEHRGWWHSLLATLNSSTSLLHLQTDAHLTTGGQAAELLLRIAGPGLVAFALFALRARIKR